MAEASSLVGKLETDVEIKAPAGKFHHMFAGRPHHVSKATPGNIQNCELHEGDWGKVGSVVIWNYVHGKPTLYIFYFYNTYNKFHGEAKVAKERVEAVEPEKNLITFRVVEGDLMKEYKSFVITIQVTLSMEGLVVLCTGTLSTRKLAMRLLTRKPSSSSVLKSQKRLMNIS
ncbi:unnamed protein product [Brassica rapa]|uniref:Bet v I/Major latex protein domain-containing protein n=2 Tax=Brassica TaxID=3705 RepID=A0A8D9M025_BRACM|nr:unnamed protein product [Brassica napus]CAG7893291.1 unnamed protein product [Brassica rapa]